MDHKALHWDYSRREFMNHNKYTKLFSIQANLVRTKYQIAWRVNSHYHDLINKNMTGYKRADLFVSLKATFFWSFLQKICIQLNYL